MKFVAKTFLFTYIWRRYKRVFVAIAMLLLSYFLISLLHGDFLNYARNTESTALLGASYLLKWLALLIATVAFYFYATSSRSNKISDSQIKHLKNRNEKPAATSTPSPDPFEAIRKKEKLKSKADLFLEDEKK